MRLSRIWRILQIKEGVIHRGRRPTWITPSEICRILHILRKPSLIQYGEDSFQIWWTAAGYGELCVWFKPIRNGKIFWMNNNIDISNAADWYMKHCLHASFCLRTPNKTCYRWSTYLFHKTHSAACGLREDGVKITNDSYFCLILLGLGNWRILRFLPLSKVWWQAG